MANITLLGASYTDVPAVTLPQTGGGVATFYESVPWNYIGDDAELIDEIYPKTEIALEDTTYPSWTPSTTAKAIVATQTLSSEAFTADFTQYEYLLRWKWAVVPAFNEGATLKVQIYRECAEQWQWIGRRPNSIATINAQNFAGNSAITYFSAPLTSYYNSSGVLTYTYAVSYGIYAAVTSPTFASSTATSTKVTPKTPTWNARCSTTYFSTTRAKELDQANTKLYMRGELYRIKTKGAVREMYENMIALYNDPTNP